MRLIFPTPHSLSGGHVLVYCYAGISRSVTITLAYLMVHCEMRLDAAYKFVKQKKPDISPNIGFMGQLVKLEKSLVGQWCVGNYWISFGGLVKWAGNYLLDSGQNLSYNLWKLRVVKWYFALLECFLRSSKYTLVPFKTNLFKTVQIKLWCIFYCTICTTY